MIVISDASPIIALDNIGKLELLKYLFKEVIITDIVRDEVQIGLPKWIVVEKKYDKKAFQIISQKIDKGEASSIALCNKYQNCKLLIDERKGRAIANEMGIEIIGLLGVIVLAKKEGHISEGLPIIEKLIKNGFRISEKIVSIVKSRLNE